jgi:hypothetical protein
MQVHWTVINEGNVKLLHVTCDTSFWEEIINKKTLKATVFGINFLDPHKEPCVSVFAVEM